MAVLDEVADTVNLVIHTKVQIPGLIHIYVPYPFVVTGDPILHDVVVLTLVHHVQRLDVTGICGPEDCVHTVIFVSYF